VLTVQFLMRNDRGSPVRHCQVEVEVFIEKH